MRVVIAGVHGRVARRLAQRLCARGDAVVGLVPTPEAEADLAAERLDTVVLDLERARVDDLAAFVVDADAVVFAAGVGAEPEAATAARTATRPTGRPPCCSPTPRSRRRCGPTC